MHTNPALDTGFTEFFSASSKKGKISYLAAQDWRPVACDSTFQVGVPVIGPVENASAVEVPVAVAAVVAAGTGVEAGIPVTAVESALGRVPRGTNDRMRRELAAQRP